MKKILTIILAILVAIGGASCIAGLVKKGDSGGGGSSGTRDSSVIDPAQCEHSESEWYEKVAPTCTGAGIKALKCKACGTDLGSDTEIPLLKHLWGDFIAAKDATCTEIGWEAYQICKRCGDSTYVEIEMLPHESSSDAWNIGREATCTTAGEKHHICLNCGTSFDSTVIPAKGHTAGDWVVDEEPTCTERGSKHKECTACGVTVDTAEIDELGHVEVKDSAVAATCTTAGKTEGKHCSRCNTVLTVQTNIAALGHVEVTDAAIAATCTTAGKTEGKHCSRCTEVLTAQTDIPALGHVEVIDPAVEATQTVPGKTAGSHCSRCNEVLVAQEDVPFANGYTVTFTEDYTSGDVSPDVVVILTFTDSTKKYIARRECGEHKNVVSMQIQENSESVYLKYQMNGKEFIIYNKGSGNASDVVTLFGNVSITWYIYGQECILSDSLVTMADGTKKALGDIVVGDKVLSYDWDTMNLVENEVVYASGQDNSKSWTVNRYFVWTFSDGTIIKSAFAHRFYNLEKRKFVYLEFWEIGEHIYKEDGTYAALVSVETIYEECTFARITLKNGTNYFANGALTGDRHCPSDLVFGSLQSSEEVIE